ncbi:hypothetical protein PHISCL_09094 [Aspergillus sclerotialis]|uniref:Uncharacterized protein n=1 Tax=Aspergillus sclerotialis TaxID=2070753 RepID=A0A3A2ZL14_9EURO|nr:hypothetical protein PHISCL_09094 [Aspergillus sclerotialis]
MSIYWVDKELIVTVYFTSRGYTDAAVADVLEVRGYRRSVAAVRRKVEGIVREYPHLLLASGKWNIIEVDWWLDHLSLAHDAVSDLIGCNALDVAIAEEHYIADRILHTLADAIRYRIDYYLRTESQSSDNTSS